MLSHTWQVMILVNAYGCLQKHKPSATQFEFKLSKSAAAEDDRSLWNNLQVHKEQFKRACMAVSVPLTPKMQICGVWQSCMHNPRSPLPSFIARHGVGHPRASCCTFSYCFIAESLELESSASRKPPINLVHHQHRRIWRIHTLIEPDQVLVQPFTSSKYETSKFDTNTYPMFNPAREA